MVEGREGERSNVALYPCWCESNDVAGHWVHAEKPVEFVTSVSTFMWNSSKCE